MPSASRLQDIFSIFSNSVNIFFRTHKTSLQSSSDKHDWLSLARCCLQGNTAKSRGSKVQTPQGLFFHQMMKGWTGPRINHQNIPSVACLHPPLPSLLQVPQTNLPTRHLGPFFYLTTSGLSCGTQDLRCHMWVLVPDQGPNSSPLHQECTVLNHWKPRTLFSFTEGWGQLLKPF